MCSVCAIRHDAVRGAFWSALMHMERLDSAEIGGMPHWERVERMKAQGRIMFREVRRYGEV